jgi:hypothetical protein
MKRKKPTAVKRRSWRINHPEQGRISRLGQSANFDKTAEAAAVAEFDLAAEQRRGLVVQEH